MSDQADTVLRRLADALAIVFGYAGLPQDKVLAAIAEGMGAAKLPAEASLLALHSTEDQLEVYAAMITIWWTSPKFTSESGQPIVLPVSGSEASIETLLAAALRVNSQVRETFDPVDVAARLVATGNAQPTEDGGVRVLQRGFQFRQDAQLSALLDLARVADFATTVAHNAYDSQGGRFERVARVKNFPVSKIPIVNQRLKDHGMSLLEDIDSYIENERGDLPTEPTEVTEIGVGMYMLVGEAETITIADGDNVVPITSKKESAKKT